MLRTVERNEDMSPDTKLRIHVQFDGDIQVTIISNDGKSLYKTVEFCAMGEGGGRSLKTREALFALMTAMEEDNTENPI